MSDDFYPPNTGQDPTRQSSSDPDEQTGCPAATEHEKGADIENDQTDTGPEEMLGDIGTMLAEKDAQIAELNERFLRLAAELENTRRRAEREKADAGKYAIKQLASELVTVADNFDRALTAVPVNHDEIGKEALDGLITGIRMTEKELLGILERYQVFRVFPKGERFDPNLHQAVAQVPGNGIPSGHVVDVAQPGFVIGDRVLRAAIVTVSLGEQVGGGPATEETGAPSQEEPQEPPQDS